MISAILPGHPPNILADWLSGSIPKVDLGDVSVTMEWILICLSVFGAMGMSWFAYYIYCVKTDKPAQIKDMSGPAYDVVLNKYYVDELYFGKIINPLIEVSRGLWNYIDVNFIDKTTYWISDLVRSAGGGLRAIQSGNTQQYALYLTLGIVGAILILFAG